MGLNSSKMTLDEQLREIKRTVNRSVRELDRERARLEVEEKKLVQDIRLAASKGETTSAKIMAKDLVRTRKHKEKFFEMRSQLKAINLRLQTVKSTQAMSDSMKGVSKVLRRMNNQVDIPAMQHIVRDFIRESEKLGMAEDVMSDAVDMAVGSEEEEEEEDKIISQVFEEIGLDLSSQIAAAPSSHIGSSIANLPGSKDNKRLDERISNLKNQ